MLLILNYWFLAFLLIFLNERKQQAGNDYLHFCSVSESYWTVFTCGVNSSTCGLQDLDILLGGLGPMDLF